MQRTVDLVFGGEVRKFRLGIGQLRDLEAKCNAGAGTIFARLVSYQPQAADFRRPRPETFPLGTADPDYLAEANLFMLLRSVGGDWRIDDIRETIRLGLEGGGMTSDNAYVLVATHIDAKPGGLIDLIEPASKILEHALANDPDDPAGKAQAETQSPQAPAAMPQTDA